MNTSVPDLPIGLSVRPRARRRLLGQMLLERGFIDQVQLDEILLSQRTERGSRVGRLLVDRGYVTEAQICEVIADQLDLPAADFAAVDIPADVLRMVPREICLRYVCLPWFVLGRDLYLIMADPTNLAAAAAAASSSGLAVKPVVAAEGEVVAALERFYPEEDASLARPSSLEVDLAGPLAAVSETQAWPAADQDLERIAQAIPLMKLVNGILTDAVRAGASHVHIEPELQAAVLRYRVDGRLRLVLALPKSVQQKVVSRIKILAQMDIRERRKPQSGRAFARVDGRSYDLRVSTLPTADGEAVVVRIRTREGGKVALEELGFEPDILAALLGLLGRPQGMILVSGPTGSGTSSTLYASLNRLSSEATHIVAVEDPVECRLGGVSQVAVSSRQSFAAALRSILPQDPDVVLVGEIRDLETAQVAFHASRTGRLVLSALPAADASSAASQLALMGLPAYVVASSLLAVLAQRLVRRLCECKTRHPDGTATPRGCDLCRFTGFKGRIVVCELLRLTPGVRDALLAGASDDVVRRAARASGMQTMFADGALKCARGLTVIEEVARVVPPDGGS
jgi:type IV pilus assembly protein PilB